MLGNSLLLCNSNFVFKRRRFYDIRLQKMSWPWNLDQMSLKVIESGTIRNIVYGLLLVFFSNIVPKMHRFWDIRLLNCQDHENRVRVRQDHWKCHHAIERIMTSYWRSIVTMALISCRFWDIQCWKMSWPWNQGQRPLKVIDSGIIR